MDKALLILDLDETLIYASKTRLSRDAACSVFDYKLYERPSLKTFMDQVSIAYNLAIWSSASDDYVDEVIKQQGSKTIIFNSSGEDPRQHIEGTLNRTNSEFMKLTVYTIIM